jgi:hypothetical protein
VGISLASGQLGTNYNFTMVQQINT